MLEKVIVATLTQLTQKKPKSRDKFFPSRQLKRWQVSCVWVSGILREGRVEGLGALTGFVVAQESRKVFCTCMGGL
jgi:hypothetical protein